jgi:hypothetical protein
VAPGEGDGWTDIEDTVREALQARGHRAGAMMLAAAATSAAARPTCQLRL